MIIVIHRSVSAARDALDARFLSAAANLLDELVDVLALATIAAIHLLNSIAAKLITKAHR